MSCRTGDATDPRASPLIRELHRRAEQSAVEAAWARVAVAGEDERALAAEMTTRSRELMHEVWTSAHAAPPDHHLIGIDHMFDHEPAAAPVLTTPAAIASIAWPALDHAVVTVHDGAGSPGTVHFIKEDGQWKLDLLATLDL